MRLSDGAANYSFIVSMPRNQALIWKSAIGLVLAVGLLLLYPREVVLVPDITMRVHNSDGSIVVNGEVCRTYNHFLGDGWKTTLLKTDSEGFVKFNATKRRVPPLIQGLKIVFSPFGHYYPGLAVSIVARDSQNHFLWQRIDDNDENLPNEIIIQPHDRKGEADESHFCTFGETVGNE